MIRSQVRRFVLLLLMGLVLVLQPTLAQSAAPPTQGVTIRPIGNPTWQPVDFHLFSAPIGTPATGFAEFFQTLQTLLPPPNHQPHPQLGIGPGAPHPPPYDAEIAASLANSGFHEGVHFSTSEFSNGQGVFLAAMNIPAPGTVGSSPDFSSGPIIPNSLFPIQVTGTTFHNNEKFSESTIFEVPKLDSNLNPPFTVDGHSHFPNFFADNAAFALPGQEKLNGSYVIQIDMIDQTGNGWHIEAHFAVAP